MSVHDFMNEIDLAADGRLAVVDILDFIKELIHATFEIINTRALTGGELLEHSFALVEIKPDVFELLAYIFMRESAS